MLVYRPPCVDQTIARTMMTTALMRPACTCCRSEVLGRRRVKMSTAKSVPQLFRAEAMVLISAASRAAEISPFMPLGISCVMSTGSVWLAFSPMRSRNST